MKRSDYAMPLDNIGQKFGCLTVLSYLGIKQNKSFVLCKCDCGIQKPVRWSHISSGTIKSCGCIQKSGFKGIKGDFLYRIRNSAKKRQIDWNITNEYIWNLYLYQNKKCALSGICIDFTKYCNDSIENIEQTASLDRIDSNLGYVENNVQWVHKDVNIMKKNFNESIFLYFINLAVNPLLDKSYNSYLYIKNRRSVVGWSGCGNLGKKRYSEIIRSAKRRNIDFSISIEDCWNLFVKQNGKCAITNLNLAMTTVGSAIENTASLDRIDSSLGYVVDNVQWVHKNINQMKWDFTMKEFLDYCNIINNFNRGR